MPREEARESRPRATGTENLSTFAHVVPESRQTDRQTSSSQYSAFLLGAE